MDKQFGRRELIRSAGAFGGLFAVGSLPRFAAATEVDRVKADESSAQKLFAGRSRHERLSLAYQHIKIGLEKPFSILHISDTHLCAIGDGETEYRRQRATLRQAVFGGKQEEALRDSLAWAVDNVDAVLHTGDLIDFQTQANYDLVKKYFGENANMFGCLGNHEFQRKKKGEPLRNTREYNALSYAELKTVYPFDIELQSTVLNGVNFVAIEQVYGFVTESQVERFHGEVKKGLPIILCMHAPFNTGFIRQACRKFWSGCGKKYRPDAPSKTDGEGKKSGKVTTTTKFIDYLKKEPLLKGILAGHLHFTIQDRFSPTAMEYVVGPNFLFNGQEILFS